MPGGYGASKLPLTRYPSPVASEWARPMYTASSPLL